MLGAQKLQKPNLSEILQYKMASPAQSDDGNFQDDFGGLSEVGASMPAWV